MDNEEIRRRALAARECEHAVDGKTFRLRLPTPTDVQIEMLRAGDDRAAPLVMQRAVLERAVIGWFGVTVNDLIAGEGVDNDAADFAPMLVPLLFDSRPDICQELAAFLIGRASERNARLEAARKN